MDYKYKDVFDFQKKHKTKEEREKVLKKPDDAEIWHLAKSCGTPQGGAYYASHMKNPDKYRTKKE